MRSRLATALAGAPQSSSRVRRVGATWRRLGRTLETQENGYTLVVYPLELRDPGLEGYGAEIFVGEGADAAYLAGQTFAGEVRAMRWLVAAARTERLVEDPDRWRPDEVSV